jgi:hypothetical protein
MLPIVAAVVIISIILKGYALWHSARNHQKAWFIVLLVIHTAGILDAVYLLFFREDNSGAKIAPPPATPPTSSAA